MTDETEATEPPTFPREVGTTFNADRILVDEAELNTLKTLNVLVDDGEVTLDEFGKKIDETEAAVVPAGIVDPKTSKPATTPPVAPVSPVGAAATDNEGGGAK
jgi:hypothetical protein